MNTKKVLVAFDSVTMRSLIGQKLTEKGYEVIYANDGLDVLYKVCSERPAVLLCYYDLPVIAGFSLSRIIKNTPALKDTSVIVCTTESSSVIDFWKENSQGNGTFLLEEENGDELVQMIENECTRMADFISRNPDSWAALNFSTTELTTAIVKAYEHELFKLYIIQQAFYTGDNMDIDYIARSMMNHLGGVYSYDALGLIVNDESIREYYARNSRLSKEDIEDFMQICHSDFASSITSRKEYNWQNSLVNHLDEEDYASSSEKIRSYECFPRDKSKATIFTLHVGTRRPEAFNPRTIERIEFFVRVYTVLMTKALEYNKAVRSENKIHRAFSRFIPEQIIENILVGDNTLSATVGEKRKVAILIADIRSFTTISEINEPEKIVKFLNQYFTRMGAIIKKYGGTIDKFMGDAIMALFGAPDSYEDNGNRAARAAMEMMQELKSVDISELRMPEGYTFSIGIGIHYGQPIVGSIGSEEKKEYTVIGDDVNITSRIEGLTKLYGKPIVISGSVKRDIDEYKNTHEENTKIFMRHLDNVKVKGKSIAVEIYELSSEDNLYPEAFLDNYSKALNQYKIGNFDSALDYFTRAEKDYPEDKAAQVMQQRCRDFLEDRPADWDGAVTLTTK